MSARMSRLSTLLRVRRIQEEVSRGHLAGELAAERRATQILQLAHALYSAPKAEQLMAAGTAQVFLAQRRDRGALAGSVRVAGVGVNAAAQSTVLARHGWSEAAVRMTALERLDDRAREVARIEGLAAEQRTSEESSSARTRRGPVSRNQVREA